ncbi:MAG TPA: hypothetical protein PKD90_15845 [Phnomibacter sp.]|nr:hypothetical protein [Phnomibacter sp.]
MALNVGLSVSARIEMLDSLLRHDRWWTRAELLKEVCNYVSIRPIPYLQYATNA